MLRLVDGVAAAADALAELDLVAGDKLLVVHSGRQSGSGYAARLIEAVGGRGLQVVECEVHAANDTAVGQVRARAVSEQPRYVVGVGGGRVLDVAKLGASQSPTEFISMPTQASSDGICSPVAVIVSDNGRPQSRGSRIPAGIVVDMEVLRTAPTLTWRSGLGDLVSNLSAVRDWRDAHVQRAEAIDDFACLTAEAAALSVVSEHADLTDFEYQEKLVRGLILSGIAMEMAGSSRPASGSEHLISHALDALLERPHLHGLQVALASVATAILRGDDSSRLVTFYRRVGLPVVPADLGVSMEEFGRAIRSGPQTRPGRSTLLDTIGEGDLRRLEAAYAAGLG